MTHAVTCRHLPLQVLEKEFAHIRDAVLPGINKTRRSHQAQDVTGDAEALAASLTEENAPAAAKAVVAHLHHITVKRAASEDLLRGLMTEHGGSRGLCAKARNSIVAGVRHDDKPKETTELSPAEANAKFADDVDEFRHEVVRVQHKLEVRRAVLLLPGRRPDATGPPPPPLSARRARQPRPAQLST